VDGSEPPTILLDSPYKEIWGVFSPDGRYLAYVSDESGRDEVHVVGFPDTSRTWAVTNDECNQPLWWGNEIFFRCGDRAMSLDVETEPEFRVTGKPELMFEGPYDYGEGGDSHWDISPDGERFAMIRLEEASRPRQIEIVLNWHALVHRAFETGPQVNP
jgi:serine/threonine-protein kinase